MNYIDSHSHIVMEGFNLDEALKHIDEVGFKKVMIVCLNLEEAAKALQLAQDNDLFDVAIGIHPSDVKDYDIDILNEIKEIAKNPKVVAIGEIGLDYYWDKDNKDDQRMWFIQQIELANELNLPIIIHSRDAIEETYQILKQYPAIKKGVMHCYSSSYEMAKEFVKLGYLISFAGPLTFKNAKVPQEVVKRLPLHSMLLETDCPFLTPEPFRGKKNEPAYVIYNYQKVAELKNIEIEHVIKQFEQNYFNLFHK